MALHFIHRFRAPLSRAVAAVAAGLVVAAGVGSAVQAVTSKSFDYSTEETGYFTIHPLALDSIDDAAVPDSLPGIGKCYGTGVNLPDGASMKKLSVWSTTSEPSNFNIELFRTELNDGITVQIAGSRISDTSGQRQKTEFKVFSALRVVDNAAASYGLRVCLGGAGTFHGARISYTYTSAGD